MHQRMALLVAGSALAMALQGCAPVVVGGVAMGAAIVHDRRTSGTVVEDQNIEIKAYEALRSDADVHEQSHINVTSYNLAVLLTGETPTPALKERAGALVKDVERVKHVYNELVIAAPSSFMNRSSDTVITGKVKTSLFSVEDLPGFDPTRVKVVTENGTVFLMGLVTQAEADAVTETVRSVGGVQRVVKLFEYIG